MSFFQDNKGEFHTMEKELYSLEKPQLSSAERRHLKTRLLATVQQQNEHRKVEYIPAGYKVLVKQIRSAVEGVRVPSQARFRMKESVLDYAESSLKWHGGFFGGLGFARHVRSSLAALTLFVFCAGLFAAFPLQAPVTYARDTVFGSVQGDVLVMRRSGIVKAKAQMRLEEGDTVLTRAGSFATIHFLDESLSRLGENTSLKVRRLYQDSVASPVTDVRVFLEEGRLWTRVVSLVDARSRFVVNTSSIQAEVEKKAAFDIASSDEGTEIAVFDNVVKLSGSSGASSKPKTLVAGYSAEINSSEGDVKIERLTDDDAALYASVWTATNLESDEEYRKILEKEKEEMISQEENGLWAEGGTTLSNEEAEALRMKALNTLSVLAKAKANLVRGTRNEALSGLNEFELSIRTVLLELDELKKREPVFAALVHDIIDEKIQVQLKDLSGFRPGHSLYVAKELLRYVEFLLAETSIEKAGVQMRQAGDILIEIEDIMDEADVSVVGLLLDEYQQRTNAFTALVSESVQQYAGSQEQATQLSEMIALQAEHMNILTAIEQSLSDDQAALRDRVRAVRKDTLVKFIAVLEQIPYPVDQTVLYELKDLYATYSEGGTDEEALLGPAVDKFLIEISQDDGADGGINFDMESLNEIPATGDVTSG